MRNYHNLITLLCLVTALTACGEEAAPAKKITPSAVLERFATELVKQHKSEIQGHSAPIQTLETPLSYVTQFFTNTPAMLTATSNDGDKSLYEKNLAITEKWQQMYCTDALQARLRETGIAIASAQLIDSAAGEKHSLAMCVATQPKSPPTSSNSALPETGQFSLSQICKAGLSLVYSRDTGIMSATVNGDQVQVKYTRQTDGKAMSYRCKLHQGLILTWDDSIAGARWYGSDLRDSKLEYQVTGDQLVVRDIINGSVSSEKLFSAAEIRREN
ncbi:hypothetical protein ACEN9F_09315 [Duganella sp. CT11-25]|uniref:hypothetical protein n=1 Tax=unclassified Duganella TaxID=2636909 RepID=UPI0039AF9536